MLTFHALTPFLDVADIPAFLEVQVADEGAARVLDALGLTDAHAAPRDDAASFLGRVLVGQALAPYDQGAPATISPDGRIISAGLCKGYIQTRLMPLGDLARYCLDEGLLVGWRTGP